MSSPGTAIAFLRILAAQAPLEPSESSSEGITALAGELGQLVPSGAEGEPPRVSFATFLADARKVGRRNVRKSCKAGFRYIIDIYARSKQNSYPRGQNA